MVVPCAPLIILVISSYINKLLCTVELFLECYYLLLHVIHSLLHSPLLQRVRFLQFCHFLFFVPQFFLEL